MDEPKTTDRSAASPEPLSLAQAPPSGVVYVWASLQDNLKMEVPDGHGYFFFAAAGPPADRDLVDQFPRCDFDRGRHRPGGAASRCCSASAMPWKTSSHQPGLVWRSSRMVGYQGLSSRSSSHRQSGEKGKAIQTGIPSAPARCAIDVSTLMTRSRLFITAAVSRKSPKWLPRSVTGKRP